METYQGYIESTDDALLIFEACRLGMLQRVTRRLSDEERQGIKSGSVFVWDEGESGIRRWTDGKRWSPSRVNGCFLMYTELESKTQVSSAGKSTSGKSRNSRKTNASSSSSQALGTPAPNGLVKKALSLFTAQNTKLHLVCYYSNEDLANAKLTAPSSDLLIGNLPIPRSLYPDVIPELIHTLHPATTAASRQQHQQQGAPAFTSLPLTPASSIHDGYSTGNNSRRQSHYDIAYATPTNANSTPVMVGSGYMVHESFAAPEPHYELSAPNTSTQTPFSSGFSLSSPPSRAYARGRLPSLATNASRRNSTLQHAPPSAPCSLGGCPVSPSAPQDLQRSSPMSMASSRRPSVGQHSPLSRTRVHSSATTPHQLAPFPRSRRPSEVPPLRKISTFAQQPGASDSTNTRLPPISELLKSLDRDALKERRPSISNIVHGPSSDNYTVSKARTRYSNDPWTRTRDSRAAVYSDQ